MAKEIAPQLQKRGHVTRGWLGVSIQDLTPELAKSLGLKESKGALVAQVVPGGPADKAGIEQGDVIVNFDGQTVGDSKGSSPDRRRDAGGKNRHGEAAPGRERGRAPGKGRRNGGGEYIRERRTAPSIPPWGLRCRI
ncbi:MAG: PDZ domain-containing protein [Desulfobacterales bacterium]|nr:PDZ domain-containing protein [Desulfobacterales bacterium]